MKPLSPSHPDRLFNTSMYVNDSYFRAVESTRGSAEYTPSTLFLAIRMTSASISAARSAAVVSVEKNGLPVPACKNDDATFFQMANRSAPDIRFSDLLHFNRRLYARRHIQLFQRILQCERVHDRRQHAHIIGGSPVNALRAAGNASPDVTPPTTMATSTPISTTSFTCSAIDGIMSASIPYPFLPAKDSPLSFSTMRLYAGCFNLIIPPFRHAEDLISCRLNDDWRKHSTFARHLVSFNSSQDYPFT